MIVIKSKEKIGSTWLIDYVEPLPCGCGYTQRKTVQIKQEKEPSIKQIENAISKD